ncbi:hypothetical protein BDZ97DRAFT_2074124 [Flammula alnicola]|nr:hypothetical protein BDZ97DRAFT_1923695 [Flammula alnicola]KAF8966439.1 hypothetical protein BDZ97DRAFT_2074124 [Flammula alnicola]
MTQVDLPVTVADVTLFLFFNVLASYSAAQTAIAKLRHVLPASGAFLICAPVHESDNHLTARVFEGVGDGAYVGGVHLYLDDRDPTFEAKQELDEGDVKFSKRYNKCQ